MLQDRPQVRPSVLCLCLAVVAGLTVPAVSVRGQTPPATLQFDFGAGRSSPETGFVAVTQGSRYSRQQSYGLLTDSLVFVEKPALVKSLGTAAADGLSKRGAIEFRVDLPKGRYAVEVMMDGGRLETWRGEIAVNGMTLATVLESFGYSPESAYAPPYWACIRLFETDRDHAIFRIRADGQPTSVNSIVLYPVGEGPLHSSASGFVRNRSASAPNFDLALKMVNAGKIAEAARIIDAIPTQWNLDRAFLLMALASRPETQTPRQVVETAFGMLSSEYARTRDQRLRLPMRLAELFILADEHYRQAGWEWARSLNGMGIFGNCEISGVSASEVASLRDNPLWPASVWHLARTCYWLWIEQHVPRMIVRADSLFTLVRAMYPDNPLLGFYLADRDRSLPEISRTPGTPHWARLQTTLVNRLKHVIHYWCETRQAANGEFGGKYDDDVEMLRWWPFARVGIDDSITLAGMKRLVDGIWESDWISNGWCKKVRDVEHSSEPVADTQPMMIAFEYGNPVYVERCMQSVKLALDLWTSTNARGHRHFRSSWYSSTQVDTAAPKDCDVPYNTRTVKAIRWFAWYTRHPEALKFLREWSDSWLEDCLRVDKGKPYGVVPAAIRFSDDAIGGHAENWHHPGLFWTYYDYGGGSDMLMEFLASYQLFGDAKYLRPIEASLELLQKHQPGFRGEVGSEAWAVSILRHSGNFWEVAELWRLMTGDSRFDGILSNNGSPYLRYHLTSTLTGIEDALTGVLRDVDLNLPLLTTEAYFTDRVEIRHLRAHGENDVSVLESMYLGAPLGHLFYPFSPVFWRRTDSTFSALVERSSRVSLRVRVFNHSGSTTTGDATFLQLEPGEYEVLQGTGEDRDGKIDKIRKRETLRVTQRNSSFRFEFLPQREELIDVRQVRSLKQKERALCDLALASSELTLEKVAAGKVNVSIPIHNIGTDGVSDVAAELTPMPAGQGVLGQVKISRIDAPLDLLPRIHRVTFTMPDRPGRYSIRVAGPAGMEEITQDNNAVEFTL